MPRREASVDTFVEELELVIARHNDLFNEIPEYLIAILIHEADFIRGKHGIDLDVEELLEDVYMIELGDGDSAAFLGIGEDPTVLEELDRDDLDGRTLGIMGAGS